MFSSVLIANRGEIACRIARTAARLGLRTIAVYSQADANALHVRLCDEAHEIGPAAARDSYLSIERLIETASRAGADCIHPGYGFLSENAAFAQACAQAGVVFVGPPPAAIRAMGLKDRAKTLMEAAGVPVVPGYHGERQEPAFLKQKAYEIGYPLLVKAIAGGGGRGMRRVERHAEFDAALEGAQREAMAAFGEARVLIEKYIAAPRHIEFQVFADTHGNTIHLNERDCSLQRRHQKVVEEAPAPGMSDELRRAMGQAAVRAAEAVGYVGAGTVEFIADGSRGLKPDGYWFMEMNTRLQVEHPVTEAVTGLDLVEWQFRVAAGEPLPLAQEEVPLHGHAFEARIYAEDPQRDFLPSTGRLLALEWPQGEGIRLDTGVEAGDEITPYYDPMIAKLIAHGSSREAALERLRDALGNVVVAGPYTNAGFLWTVSSDPDYVAGRFDTGFIARKLTHEPPDAAAAARGAVTLVELERARIAQSRAADEPPSPWDATDAFQLSGTRSTVMTVLVDGEPSEIAFSHTPQGLRVAVDGVPAALDGVAIAAADGAVHVVRLGRQTLVRRALAGVVAGEGEGDGSVRAPMHGKVLALMAAQGDQVAAGQRLGIIEAMKMEHALTAPFAGTVASVAVAVGDQVAEGAMVMTIVPAGEGR